MLTVLRSVYYNYMNADSCTSQNHSTGKFMGRIANDDDIGSPKPHSFTPVMLIGCNMICVSCRY